jgi:hypothetical protein
MVASFKHGDELSESMKDGVFIDQSTNYQVLNKKDFAPWSYLVQNLN